MTLPAFTAESSLYRTNGRYRSSVAHRSGSTGAHSVVAAFSSTACSDCENKCNDAAADCVATATAVWGVGLAGCAIFGPFAPLCAGAVTTTYLIANGVCFTKLAGCHAINCNLPGKPCCPVSCSAGHCCAEGETCMAHGCCPSGRVVCGGDCCSLGASCCGNKCCPPGSHCCGDTCCAENIPCCGNTCCSLFPPGTLPPTPPINNCIFGGEPCGGKCCPPGLQCCGIINGQPDCKMSCLR